jgi:hemin uptake protein HemP
MHLGCCGAFETAAPFEWSLIATAPENKRGDAIRYQQQTRAEISDKNKRQRTEDDIQPGSFGRRKMIIIRHDQEEYRLQLTATGKLILTK